MHLSSGNTEVIILAAGKGVRMCSNLPKVLHRVCGRTLLERAALAALGVGPSNIFVVVGFAKELVETEISKYRQHEKFKHIQIKSVFQSEQLGTGHAVQMASPCLDAKTQFVVVMPGDCPLVSAEDMKTFVAGFEASSASMRILTSKVANPQGFGRVIRNAHQEVLAIIEEKDCTEEQRQINEINSAIYIFRREILELGLKSLKPANAQGEYYLPDLIDFSVQRGEKVEALCVCNPEVALGANNRMELSELEQKRRQQITSRHMLQGVTFEDPTSTYIDEDVTIGGDTFIGAGTRLHGNTSIGSQVVIEGNALIANSKIASGSRIKLFTVIESSEIDAHCTIGPFAHIRPGSHLHENVKIGNFVETKKTIMHEGAKANHLSYLGDAQVGAHSNIGAGTITCNYDGHLKHETVIGNEAFIGSNTCLVAPVKVGSHSYVGAGSTITKDVPDGALGIARGKQNNIDGWVKRKETRR